MSRAGIIADVVIGMLIGGVLVYGLTSRDIGELRRRIDALEHPSPEPAVPAASCGPTARTIVNPNLP